MDLSATWMVALRLREQLLPQPEFTPGLIGILKMNQTQVNKAIGRFSLVDTAELTTQMVTDVNRQLAAASDHLAQLAHTIETTIAQTTHDGEDNTDSATQNNTTGGHAQAPLLHLYNIPAELLGTVIAASDLITIAHLKSTARPIRDAVRPIARSLRLPKAIERAGVSGVVHFDDQLGHSDVMKAMWMMEEGGEGGWREAGGTLRLAEHGGYCQLPLTVGAADLQTHATKAQDGTLELFRNNNNEIRVIRNEPGFALTINPPLPLPTGRPVHPLSQHPFQKHAKPHDPPIGSRIGRHHGVGWATLGVNDGNVFASASSMLKQLLLHHRRLAVGGVILSPTVVVDRAARGGHLDRIITQSPHTPLDGCSDVTALETATGSYLWYCPHAVRVKIRTSEAPAAGVAHDAPFGHRFPLTAAKVRPISVPSAPSCWTGRHHRHDHRSTHQGWLVAWMR
ncbi:unnamed protein product [Vitrella brassicaformis CCMP3155]|uniref:Uncharacterized protein n=1 Tax=Vitrella brassicaformis (strain CCMP3155) TaxID=1169540 RepID=A0A0G4FDY9_VITBC|nr:unnamed protein product [Vitrella brassicaformis CCMP3155]|eukprot:CEM11174.1 unnamed protein product [Vitrella brassicaformis CCMP3155]